jgi:hypothetical protein
MTGPVSAGRSARVFQRFGGWPEVPTDDLLALRRSMLEVQRLGGPGATGVVLALVEQELGRRGHVPLVDRCPGAEAGSQ